MLKTLIPPKVRVALFLLALNAAWIVSAWLWLDRSQWLWITPFALSINFFLVTYDQVLSFSELESQRVLGQDPWGLLRLVEEMSKKFELAAPPQVFLLNHKSAHVFTYSRSRKHHRLFVTKGALDLFSPNELRAVLTFQILGMRGAMSVLNYWLGAIVDLLFRLGRAIERTFEFVFGWTPPLASWFVGPWVGLLQLILISPRDYLALDRETALKIAHPEDLARALWKMEAYAKTKTWHEPWVFSHMCMVSPLAASPVWRWLTPQPTLQSRIKKLIGRYPL